LPEFGDRVASYIFGKGFAGFVDCTSRHLRKDTSEKNGRPMRRQQGFSLIELLIVVAIILIIAAIAIPNLMRAKMSANDASAAASLRSINTGEIAYIGAYPTIGFSSLAALGGASPCTPASTGACLVDNYLATNGGGLGKSGYTFTAVGSASAGNNFNNQFFTTGTPLNSTTGTRAYCSIEDTVLRLQPPGNITLVAGYSACTALPAMAN
jgi:type IV pilus assembly protein PilA